MNARNRGIIALGCALLVALPINVTATDTCLRIETLMSRPADDLGPVWSPDGSRVAFVGHDAGNPEVYVYEASGNPQVVNISHHLLDDYAPLWSPDGRYLVYLHRQQRYSWQPVQPIIADMTSGQHLEVTSEFLNVRDMQWTADSQAILYADQTGYHRYDLPSRETRTLWAVSDPILGYFNVSTSQDGRRAVIVPRSEPTIIIDTASGATVMGFVESSDRGPFNRASLSPDGKHMVYIQGAFPANIFLYAYDIAFNQSSRIAMTEERNILQLTWSPDGRLAWTEVGWDRDANRPITTIRLSEDLKSAGRELLTLHHDVSQLAWSPTRDQLAFATYAGVYVIDVPSAVTHEFIQGFGHISKIVWSADGDYMAAQMGVTVNYNLFSSVGIVDIAHGGLSLLEDHTIMHGWSPVERHLLVTGSGNETDIYVLTPCIP